MARIVEVEGNQERFRIAVKVPYDFDTFSDDGCNGTDSIFGLFSWKPDPVETTIAQDNYTLYVQHRDGDGIKLYAYRSDGTSYDVTVNGYEAGSEARQQHRADYLRCTNSVAAHPDFQSWVTAWEQARSSRISPLSEVASEAGSIKVYEGERFWFLSFEGPTAASTLIIDKKSEKKITRYQDEDGEWFTMYKLNPDGSISILKENEKTGDIRDDGLAEVRDLLAIYHDLKTAKGVKRPPEALLALTVRLNLNSAALLAQGEVETPNNSLQRLVDTLEKSGVITYQQGDGKNAMLFGMEKCTLATTPGESYFPSCTDFLIFNMWFRDPEQEEQNAAP